jgi:hypothetical protein
MNPTQICGLISEWGNRKMQTETWNETMKEAKVTYTLETDGIPDNFEAPEERNIWLR